MLKSKSRRRLWILCPLGLMKNKINEPVKVCEASITRGYSDWRSRNKVRLISRYKCHTTDDVFWKHIMFLSIIWTKEIHDIWLPPLLWSNWFLDQVKCSVESALGIEISSDQRRDVRNTENYSKYDFRKLKLGKRNNSIDIWRYSQERPSNLNNMTSMKRLWKNR